MIFSNVLKPALTSGADDAVHTLSTGRQAQYGPS